jgi:hypothetical protein
LQPPLWSSLRKQGPITTDARASHPLKLQLVTKRSSWLWIPARAELVIGPAEGRTRWLGPDDTDLLADDHAFIVAQIQHATQLLAVPVHQG